MASLGHRTIVNERGQGSVRGYLCLVLHAHLPFVRHPEEPVFLEESWLFEAITEAYTPLLQALERLHHDGIPGRMTLSLSPTLLAMLADPLLMSRYRAHLDGLHELAADEVARHPKGSPLQRLAVFHRELFARTRHFVADTWRGNLIDAFRAARDRGQVELITCTATHAILPLMATEGARRAQIRVGVESHRRAFGEDPAGLWLAECAYDGGVDALLVDEGIRYSFVDTHGLLHADPEPVLGVAAPVVTSAGLALFGRDPETSRQVWSSEAGYPAHADYREFYRDLGFDAEYQAIRAYLHPDGVRRNVGIKYHRITGKVDLGHKDLYDPDVARARAREHAGNFHFNRCAQVRWLRERMDRPPVLASLYDAELFGHWWFEGPWFLEDVFRVAAAHPGEVGLVTPSEVLEAHPVVQQVEPAASTWGFEGYTSVWLEGKNAWMYRHLHRAERRMARLLDGFPRAAGPVKRWLDAAARELLLAQSSDWAFILKTGAAEPYATRRVHEHVQRFHALADAVEEGRVQGTPPTSSAQEALFPWLDHRAFGAVPP